VKRPKNGVIFFNSKGPREHLLKHGFVYTLRYPRREGKAKAVKGSFKRRYVEFLCYVYIKFVKKIESPEELESYVENSGFKTVREWVDEVKKYYGSFSARYLYRVRKITRGEYYTSVKPREKLICHGCEWLEDCLRKGHAPEKPNFCPYYKPKGR